MYLMLQSCTLTNGEDRFFKKKKSSGSFCPGSKNQSRFFSTQLYKTSVFLFFSYALSSLAGAGVWRARGNASLPSEMQSRLPL
jgi:hypothetical protein